MAHRCSHDEKISNSGIQRALAQETNAEGIIHHSDRGSQYASHEYQKILKKEKFQVSMSRKGNCYENAVIESFHSVLKINGSIRKDIEHEKKRNPAFLNILRYFIIENAVILH